MRATDSVYSPLTATLIRRAPAPPSAEPATIEDAAPRSAWRDDLRLFAVTWAMGFVFFLAFIG